MHPVSSSNSSFKINRVVKNVKLCSNDSARKRWVESDSDSSQDSLPESLQLRSPLRVQHGEPSERKCSSCSCRRSLTSRRRGESSTSVKGEANKYLRYFNVTFQQQGAKLCKRELEESERLEDLDNFQSQLHRASQLLEALALFAQSVDLKARSYCRLVSLTEDFVYKDVTQTDTLSEALDKMSLDMDVLKKLEEVQCLAMEGSKTPEQVYQLQEDFRESRKLQLSAANRYSQKLRSYDNVSVSRLAKHERRYEKIREDYEKSRKNLEGELAKLAMDRQVSVVQGLSKLAPIQDTILKYDDNFFNLCQEIIKCLRGPFKRQSSENGCVSKQPIYRKP